MQRSSRCFAEPGPRFLRVASNRGPGSAAHRSAKSYALRCVRGTHQLRSIQQESSLPLSPNIRGSLLMAVAMAGFTMNDTITKAVSAQMNFGEVMLVRGVFAVALIAALAWHQGALRPPRTLL